MDAIRLLAQQSPFADLSIEMYESLDKLQDEKLDTFENVISTFISDDGSHAVSGTYMLDNLTTRPENSLVILGELEIILNTSKDQILILEHNASGPSLHLVVDLIKQLGEIFVFVTGSNLIDKLKEQDYDNKSSNIVFRHDEIDIDRLGSIAENHTFVNLIDPSDEFTTEEIQAFGMLIWGYEPKDVTNLELPHIVMINEERDIMGGARANAISHGYAAIGGVKTLKPFRGQGVGTAVSQILTAMLKKKELQPVLETDDENIPALKIYEKLGYQKVGTSAFFDFGTDMITVIQGDRDY